MKKYIQILLLLTICIPAKSFAQFASDLTNTQLTFSDPAVLQYGATYSFNNISLINGNWMNCTANRIGFYNDTVESNVFDINGSEIQNYVGVAKLKGNFLSFDPGFTTSGIFKTKLFRGEGPNMGMGGNVNMNISTNEFQGTGTILESGYDNLNESSGYYLDGDINILWSPANPINGSITGKILSLWEEDTASEKWYVDGNGNISSSSDLRWKEQIKPLENPLEKIAKINGVSYQWKLSETEKQKGTMPYRSLGVIAQELEKVLPEAVQTNHQGHKFVSYDQIIPVLIEAVKTLDVKQQNQLVLEEKIQQLNHKNELLEKRLAEIEKLLLNKNQD